MQSKNNISNKYIRKMLNLFASILALAYSVAMHHFKKPPGTLDEVKSHQNSLFMIAMVVNTIIILSQLVITVLIIGKYRAMIFKSLNPCWLLRQYLKTTAKYYAFHQSILLIHVWLMLFLSLILFTLMINWLFHWKNYDYLLVCMFLLNCEIMKSIKSQYYKACNHDGFYTFCLEVYKYLLFIFSIIISGIVLHEQEVDKWVICFFLFYNYTRSKQSLLNKIMYCLMVFMEVIVVFTAIGVTLVHMKQDSVKIQHLIFLCQLGLIVFRLLSENQKKLAESSKDYMSDIQIYFKLSKYCFYFQHEPIRSNSENETQCKIKHSIEQNPQCGSSFKELKKNQQIYECPICIEIFDSSENLIKLECKHHFHIDCIEEWIFMGESQVCPLCRKFIDLS